ncbi:MAG: hypothetical protein Kow0074_17980 [Candidatus Zixiibacteriota bacterium]
MDTNLPVLIGTAATIGVMHTVLGPDHYLPFVAMAKARGWSRLRAITITVLCGVGHVLGSVAIGLFGVALGWAVGSMEMFEAFRGDIAAWALIGFGLAYGTWGVWRAITRRPHAHRHIHVDGTVHSHPHTHHGQHAHPHEQPNRANLTPWVLFTIFVLGPCEPLIPILMIPAAEHSWWGLLMVTAVFGVATVLTMTAVAMALIWGLDLIPLRGLERWSHALAGSAIFLSGAAIRWLGL